MMNIGSFALLLSNVTYATSLQGPLAVIPDVDRQSCVLACIRDRSCSSFFYTDWPGECGLHSLVYTSRDGPLDEPGTKYYVMKHPGCPEDYWYTRSSHQCLKVNKSNTTWGFALSLCGEEFGHLAYSKSETANQQIASMIASESLPFMWLGGVNYGGVDANGTWYWTYEDMIDYKKWAQGTPNSGHAICIDSEGFWHDVDSGLSLPYICEIDLVQFPCKLLP